MTLDPVDDPVNDPDARLQRSRWIDWRFMLADPSPGRAGHLGPAESEMLQALRDAGWELTEIPASRGSAIPRLDLDLVIVVRPGGRDLAEAGRHVRRGGTLYVACDGPFGGAWRRPRPLDPQAVVRRLAGLGFVDARVHVDVPRRDRRSAILPLEDPAALRLLLRRRGGFADRRPVRVAAEVLRRTGWLARIAPAAGVVARRGPAIVGDRDAVSTFVRAPIPAGSEGFEGSDRRPAPLLLTPTFRASRHVVALVPTPDGTRADLVAKISRQADSGEVTRREAAILAEVGSGPAAVSASAPRLVKVGTPWGLPTLLETGLVGEPLDPAAVRRDREAAIARVVPWLAAMVRPAAPDSWPAADRRLDDLLGSPMAAFASALPRDAAERRLASRTLAIVNPLRATQLPDLIEHGDVSHPNLLVTPDGSLAAVDWELGEPHGLPGHDLFGFLAYVAVADARATDARSQASAITSAMAEPDGWMDRAAGDYARRIELDAALLPALAAASWARRVVGLVERLHDGRPRAISPDTLAWLRDHRYVAAWAAAVDRAAAPIGDPK